MEEKIKEFWENIDKQINKFSSKFKYDIKQRIRRIIREFNITRDNLYSYLKNDDLSMFKSELQDIKNDNMGDYLKFKIDKMMNRTKIKYYEALQLLIDVAYFKMMDNSKKFEDELFTATTTYTSEFYQRESYDIKPRLKRFHLIPFPNHLIPHLMSTPLYLGYNWLEYKQNMIDYNANKTYRKVVIGIQQDNLDLDSYDNVFNIDKKRYINALDNETASLCSEVALWGMEKQGIKEVMFIAVMDSKTTKICQSMNEQVFKINDWNTYYRYVDNNSLYKKRYVTKGLVIGENKPALHYNCRSVLYPYK